MKDMLKGWVEAVIEAVAIVAIMYFVFFPFEVSGTSMESTLNHGDKVFVSRIMATLNMYGQGNLIVFEEVVEGENIKMVKRVIGTQGDHVVIKNGELYINGNLKDEPWAKGITDGEADVILGEGCIFVLGDNRSYSMDSRHFGVVEESQIKGRVVLKLLPIGEFQVYI